MVNEKIDKNLVILYILDVGTVKRVQSKLMSNYDNVQFPLSRKKYVSNTIIILTTTSQLGYAASQ